MRKFALTAALGLILVVAFLQMHSSADRVLSLDESLHYFVANRSGILPAILASHVHAHPPLYYLTLQLWLPMGSSAADLRLLGMTFCLGGALLAYATGRRWGLKTGAALAVSFAYATLYATTEIATEVRAYGLAQLFLWAGLWFAADIARDGKRFASHCGFGAASLLAGLTLYSAIFPVVGLTLVLYGRRVVPAGRTSGWGRLVLDASPVVTALALTFAYFAWHLSLQVPQWGVIKFGAYQGSLADLSSVAQFLSHGTAKTARQVAGNYGSVLFLLALGLSLTPSVRRQPLAGTALMALWATVGGVLCAAVAGKFPLTSQPRHFTALHPLVLLAFGVSLSALTRLFSTPQRRWVEALSPLLIALIAVGRLPLPFRGRLTYHVENLSRVERAIRTSYSIVIADKYAVEYAAWNFFRGQRPRIVYQDDRYGLAYGTGEIIVPGSPAAMNDAIKTCHTVPGKTSCVLATSDFYFDILRPFERSAAHGWMQNKVAELGLPPDGIDVAVYSQGVFEAVVLDAALGVGDLSGLPAPTDGRGLR